MGKAPTKGNGRRAAPPKRGPGHPSLYTAKLGAAVCELFALGWTMRQIEREPGMPSRMTITRWLLKHPEFCDLYVRAREAQSLSDEDALQELGEDDRNDWVEREGRDGGLEFAPDSEHLERVRIRIENRKWLMSKRAPKRYGRKVELSGEVKTSPLRAVLEEMDGSGTGVPGDGKR